MNSRSNKPAPIVTREWLREAVNAAPVLCIGRALVALYALQEAEEKSSKETRFSNGVGFTKGHARLGSIGAKAYLQTRTVPPFVLKVFTRPDKNGYPNICKYTRQLNNIAHERNTAEASGT